MNNMRGTSPRSWASTTRSLSSVQAGHRVLHISAYGRDNERKAWPGYDFLMQAEAGLMTLTGEPDGPPQRFGSSMVDYMTGMTGIAGLLACLMRAQKTGKGCDVDASLFDVAVHQLSYPGTWYINGGEKPSRLARSAHQSIAPVQTVRTSDGWIYVMCMKEKFWEVLAERSAIPSPTADPRFATAASRRAKPCQSSRAPSMAHAREDDGGVAEDPDRIFAGRADLRRGAGLRQPFHADRGHGRQRPHPAKGEFKMLANPLKIDGSAFRKRCARRSAATTRRCWPLRGKRPSGQMKLSGLRVVDLSSVRPGPYRPWTSHDPAPR